MNGLLVNNQVPEIRHTRPNNWLGVKNQCLGEIVNEGPLQVGHPSVGSADANRLLVCQLLVFGIAQRRRYGVERGTIEETFPGKACEAGHARFAERFR